MIIAQDNGTTGWICMLFDDGRVHKHCKVPTREILKYTKAKDHMNIIILDELTKLYKQIKKENTDPTIMVYVERPMINSIRFKASMSAVVSYVLTMMALEAAKLPYEWTDSKEWQKAMLPSGIQGSVELKKAAVEVSKRLFPDTKVNVNNADPVLMAEFYRRRNKGIL